MSAEDARRTPRPATVVVVTSAAVIAATAGSTSTFALASRALSHSGAPSQLRGAASAAGPSAGTAPGAGVAAAVAAACWAGSRAQSGQQRRRVAAHATTQQGGQQRSEVVVAGSSAAVPFLPVGRGLTNNPMDFNFPGDLGFDPLGFASSSSPLRAFDEYLSEVCKTRGLPKFDKLRWYREGELMHGRVAMLASLNIIEREGFEVALPDSHLEVGSELQFLQAMSILELYRGYRLLFNGEALAGDLGLGMGAGEPLAQEMTRAELATKQLRELQNGRLAMVGAFAMAVQFLNTGFYVLEDPEVVYIRHELGSVLQDGGLSVNLALTCLGLFLAFDGVRRLDLEAKFSLQAVVAPNTHTASTPAADRSSASSALNPFAIEWSDQNPGVALPAGVVAGQLPQELRLTEAQVVQFEQDGVIMVKGAMKSWVPFLRACTEYQIEHPHVWSLVGRMSGLYDYIQRNVWMTNDGFRDFLYYSPLGHCLSQVGRTPEVRMSTDMLLVNPNKGFGWHQDNQNGPIDFPDAMRWWVALDRCGENDYGAPEYLLGSHKNDSVAVDAVFVDLKEGDLSTFARSTKYLPEPGDLIIWNSRTIHRILAPPSQSWVPGTQRRAYGGTAAKGGSIYLNKGGASAISDLAGHSLQGGEELGGAYFPRLYPTRVAEEEETRNAGLDSRSVTKIKDLGVNLASNAGKYVSFTKVLGKKK